MVNSGLNAEFVGTKKMNDEIKKLFVEKYTTELTEVQEASNKAMAIFSKAIGVEPVVENEVNPAFARMLSQSKAVQRDFFIASNVAETTQETTETTE